MSSRTVSRLRETEPSRPLFPNGYAEERREESLRAYQEERWSLRGLRRTFGVSPITVIGWLKKKVADLNKLEDTLICTETRKVLLRCSNWTSCDPLSFVRARRCVWIALCRETRQEVVAFVMGDRSRASCGERLWRAIPESYKEGTCYSDLWEAYKKVIPEDQHEATGKEEGETCHVEREVDQHLEAVALTFR